MSEAKFTKGEWFAECEFSVTYGEGVVKSSDSCIAIICGTNYPSAPEGGLNRDWCDGYKAQDISEHEANSHLIAAAPSMYAMLDDLQRTLSDEYLGSSLQIRQLLAKARGE